MSSIVTFFHNVALGFEIWQASSGSRVFSNERRTRSASKLFQTGSEAFDETSLFFLFITAKKARTVPYASITTYDLSHYASLSQINVHFEIV